MKCKEKKISRKQKIIFSGLTQTGARTFFEFFWREEWPLSVIAPPEVQQGQGPIPSLFTADGSTGARWYAEETFCLGDFEIGQGDLKI